MHIIGTAGHVDHGKSSLVKSLTGTDPDRFAEEQLRGMTLDLGFAHLQLPDGQEAGIIDVPGHERFLHNMLAGAAGMEVLLLVVAANEGVMPQTREHLDMLAYLNVAKILLVVTKADMVGPTHIDAAIDAIRTSLRGTIADGAQAIPVSNLDGSGFDALRAAIASALQALPPRDHTAPVYMPIDRVFSLPGHGTIITGTLMQGQVALGDHLVLAPSQKPVRIRSIQVFGRKCDHARGGERVALALPAISRDEIGRGEVLADATFEARDRFAVRFMPFAPAGSLLRRRTPVRAYLGSAEVLGSLVFPDLANLSEATLELAHPVLAFPGVRFVVRRISPKTLLGGGEILARSDAARAGDTPTSAASAVLAALQSGGEEPSDIATLAFTTNLREDIVREALGELAERGELLLVQKPEGFLARTQAERWQQRVLDVLLVRQSEAPWSLGMTTLGLARLLGVQEASLARILLALAEDGKLARRAGYYATADHTPRLTAEQTAFIDTWVPKRSEDPLLPAPAAGVYDAIKTTRIPGMAQAFETLSATGGIVKVGDALYRGAQIGKIHAALEAWLRAQGSITVAQFRDLLGITRKYAVPLLEWCDSRGITMRNGDIRILRAQSSQRVKIE